MSVIAPSAPERAGAAPLDDASFAALIEMLGPFERRPRLAVAVSGGPDSLALCLLADRWARRHDGAIVGLTVDHGLRPEATGEARQTGAWLRERGIEHRILTWRGPKPSTRIQAAARDARYRLIGNWCRGADVLHVLLAHHRDDQAETVALRRARQSGPDGLAAMAAVRELRGLRLLRPLLPIPKTRLRATLESLGQPWIDDPSNRDATFARARLRQAGSLDAERLALEGAAYSERRAVRDQAVAGWLAANARIDPGGFARLRLAALRAAPSELAERVVQQSLMTVGGAVYPPRRARLQGLMAALRAALRDGSDFGGRTLGGCRLIPWHDDLLMCREAGAIGDVMALRTGTWQCWDQRFDLMLTGSAPDLTVRAFGQAGLPPWAHPARPIWRRLPAPVRASLPAVWQHDRIVALPHLDAVDPALVGLRVALRFRPPVPLAGPSFAITGPLFSTLEPSDPLRGCSDSLC